VHKIFLQFGALTLYWYGVLVALGFLFGLWTAGRRALQANLSPDHVVDLGPWLVAGSIIGARLFYVVSYWQSDFANQPWWEVFMVQHGGLVFYGGLVGAVLTGGFQVWRRKLPFWPLSDVLAPSVALGHALGRLGCFMNGCCYGAPTHLPWAVHFPADHATEGAGVHPTQIYESALNLLLFLGLSWFFPRRRYTGQVFALYLVFYAILRFTVECFRGDYNSYYWHLTPAQVFSFFLLAAGLGCLWWLPRRAASLKTSARKD